MLPKSLHPIDCSSLVRLGSRYDGGYVVDESSIKDTKVLVSFGVNDNWDFENEVSKTFDIPTHAYDYSVGPMLWIKGILRPLLQRFNIMGSIAAFMKPITFSLFFSGENFFYKKKIGDGSDNTVSLHSILDGLEGNIFLKMDIEGWEYRVLEDIISMQKRFSGLAIEFHDIDLHIERVTNFLKDLDMGIVSINANNTGGKDSNGNPLVIEVALSKNINKDGDYAKDLSYLSSPNDPTSPVIPIRISSE